MKRASYLTDRLDRYIGYLGYAGAAMGVAAIIIMVFLVSVNVFLRYFFKIALHFGVEYSSYLFLVVVYMGFAYSMRTDAHVSVDLAFRRFPRRIRQALEVLFPLLGLGLITLLLYYAWGMFLKNAQLGRRAYSPMETPLWMPQLFLVLGLVLFDLELVARTIRKFIAFRRGP